MAAELTRDAPLHTFAIVVTTLESPSFEQPARPRRSIGKLAAIAVAGAALFYGVFIFAVWDQVLTGADHLKVISFSVAAIAWSLLCGLLSAKVRIKRKSIRVVVAMMSMFPVIFLMSVGERWLHDDEVWRGLFDNGYIAFSLPVILALLSAMPESET